MPSLNLCVCKNLHSINTSVCSIIRNRLLCTYLTGNMQIKEKCENKLRSVFAPVLSVYAYIRINGDQIRNE